jgi:hypothetical protein
MIKIKKTNLSIFFLTYGDDRFKESRERIIKEAKKTKLFLKCILETRKIEEEKEFKKALENKQFKKSFETIKGGGCYIWKPYIIYKNLKKISENDILVYADAGSTIKNSCKKIKQFEECFIFLQEEKGVIVSRNNHLESEYCKGDVFKYFNVENNPDFFNTKKFQCSTHFIRKCEHSLKMYEKWWDIAKNRADLFNNDIPSEFPNYPNYIRHVWDTGTWSLICKTMGYSKEIKKFPIEVSRIRR